MNRVIKPNAMSLVELVLALSISAVVLLAVGVVLMNNTNVWNQMYARIQKDYNIDRQGAVRVFEKYIRQASKETVAIAADESSIEAHYYQDSRQDAVVNRYALMYINQASQLVFESGTLDPRCQTQMRIVCHDVTHCRFQRHGDSVQMFLRVRDDFENKMIMSSAVLHNN